MKPVGGFPEEILHRRLLPELHEGVPELLVEQLGTSVSLLQNGLQYVLEKEDERQRTVVTESRGEEARTASST